MKKILVIDDEESLRQLILAALRGKGFEVFEAENGAIGVQQARAHLPDLILCDVKMAQMDGYETLEALRQEPATAIIPCILMTGEPHTAGMRHGMELGADDYLPKPFSTAQLQAAVEARLRKQATLLSQAEQKMASLRANISMALPHELFTPLSGIIGFAEIICTEANALKGPEIVEIGKAIHASAKRLNRLIENFLIYAQIELLAADPDKKASLRQTPAIPTHDVLETSARYQAQLGDRSADLVLDLVPAPASLMDEYLRKIIDELLDNAFKFSEAGTSVTVKSYASADSLVFSVADQGHGMTPEQIANIGAYMQFERRFYEQQGSGLGLIIAKRLAELHSGTLTIRSAPQQGTTVTVTLPSGPVMPRG